MTNFIHNYVIENDSKNKAHYSLHFTMDFNDADYGKGIIDECPDDDYFWIMVAYLNKYGKHWEDDPFLSKFNEKVDSYLFSDLINLGLLLCNEDGAAHSFIDFKVLYYDENGVVHNVKIPDIDSLYPNRDDLMQALLDVYYIEEE